MTAEEFAESIKLSVRFDNWKDTREFVFNRDKVCQLQKTLTKEEFHIVSQDPGYRNMSRILDPCHILDKSTHKYLEFCPDNIVVMSRYFHSLLTEHRHPITKKHLDNRNEVLEWYFRAKFGKETIVLKEEQIYINDKIAGEIKPDPSGKYCLYVNSVQLGCSFSRDYLLDFFKQHHRNWT